MEHCSDIVESYTYSEPSPFTDFRATNNQQALNICPRDIGASWMRENSLQRLAMFCPQL